MDGKRGLRSADPIGLSEIDGPFAVEARVTIDPSGWTFAARWIAAATDPGDPGPLSPVWVLGLTQDSKTPCSGKGYAAYFNLTTDQGDHGVSDCPPGQDLFAPGGTYTLTGEYDGKSLRLLVDGKLAASAAASGTPRAGQDLLIGRAPGDRGPPHFFHGFQGTIHWVSIRRLTGK